MALGGGGRSCPAPPPRQCSLDRPASPAAYRLNRSPLQDATPGGAGYAEVAAPMQQLTNRIRGLFRASVKYGPIFFVEVGLFWLILKGVDASGYGHPSATFEAPWYPLISFAVVALAMGAGEARFHLYRRGWPVAGLADAFPVALPVSQPPLLVTLITQVIPAASTPLREPT